MTTNHHEDIFSSVTSRGAALWRSLSSSMMKQVQYETSMKNIPLGGNKEYVMQLTKSVRKVVYELGCIYLQQHQQHLQTVPGRVLRHSVRRLNDNFQNNILTLLFWIVLVHLDPSRVHPNSSLSTLSLLLRLFLGSISRV